jgi:amidohydrolase
MFRLGVRAPGVTAAADLHRAEFDLDERAIGIGSRVLALAALDALAELAEGAPAVG